MNNVGLNLVPQLQAQAVAAQAKAVEAKSTAAELQAQDPKSKAPAKKHTVADGVAGKLDLNA
jgi:hypothetical protein